MEILTRAFCPADLRPIVDLWNRCLPADRLSQERYWRLFLLDPNFRAEGVRIAETEGRLVGCMQTIAGKTPPGYLPQNPPVGHVAAFFVEQSYRRRGIGRRLLEEGLDHLRTIGCGSVSCNGYAPYYAFPGVDHRYEEALAFLPSAGFEPSAEAVAMNLTLNSIRIPGAVQAQRGALAREGVQVRWFEMADTVPLLAFADAHFPSWVSGVVDGLQRNNRDIMVAVRDGEVLGYTQWQNTQTDPPHGAPGRFGPFGVREDLRGQGIGAAIFWTVAESVAAAGAKELWCGWAGGRNLSFYERAGCRVTRRFRLFRREL